MLAIIIGNGIIHKVLKSSKPAGVGFRDRYLDEFRREYLFDFGCGSRWCNLCDGELMQVKNFLDKFYLRTKALSR